MNHSPPFDDPLLREWKDDDQLMANAALAYVRIQEMRNQADYYERALLRDLYYEHGLNWREISEVLNANLSSRQASRQKWRRLIGADVERRVAGAPGKRRRHDGMPS